MATGERPRFRVVEKSFIGHALVEADAEVFYTPPEGGHVSNNLWPLNDAAQALVDDQKPDHKAKTKNAAQRAKEAAEAEAEAQRVEQETNNGPVPRGQAKGDTRSEPKRSKKAKGAAEGAEGAEGVEGAGGAGDPEDVG